MLGLLRAALAGQPDLEANTSIPGDAGIERETPPLRIHLAWDAPGGCPDAETVAGDLQDRLSSSGLPARVVEAADADRWAIARATRRRGTWNLRLWMPTATGLRDRTLDGPSCAALGQAAATIVAMTLEGELAARDTTDADPDAEEVARDEADLEAALASLLEIRDRAEGSTAPPAAPDPPEAEDKPPPRGALRLDGGIGTGALPSIDGGLTLSGAAVWTRARLEVRGAYWGGGIVEIDADREARARFTLLSATIRGCGIPRAARRWTFPICVGAEAGGVLGQIAGLRFLHAPTQPWIGLHVASMIVWAPIPRVAVVGTLEPWVAALVARHVAITGEVHSTGRVGIRGFLGLEVRFGGEE
jgi:hypothetical protein